MNQESNHEPNENAEGAAPASRAPGVFSDLRNPRVLTAAALMAAVSLVLAFLAKSLFGTGPLRVTFENLPILLGSLLFGPAVGALIAVCADLLSCLIAGMAPNLIITAGAAAVGFVSGVFFRYLMPESHPRLRLIVSVAAGHLVGSVLIKSIGLYVYYGPAVFWRIPLYAAIAAAESLLMILLFENGAFLKQIEKFRGNTK